MGRGQIPSDSVSGTWALWQGITVKKILYSHYLYVIVRNNDIVEKIIIFSIFGGSWTESEFLVANLNRTLGPP